MDTQEGQKKKNEFYNRPWFWVIVGVVIIVAVSISNNPTPNGQDAQPIVQSPGATASATTATNSVPKTTQKAPTTPKINSSAAQQPRQSQQTYATPSGAVVSSSGSTVAPPPAPPASWHTVATFSGSADTNTNDFAIKGSKWRIDWSFSFPASNASYCQQYGCNLAVQVFQDDNTYVDQFLQEGQQPSSGIVYEYGKPTGNMYLHVVGGNVSWTLTVEDYY